MRDDRWEQKYLELRTDQNVYQYEKAGVYGIKINHMLVYIGKSIDILMRMTDHILGIEDAEIHKYKILKEAQNKGYTIRFQVFYETKCESEEARKLDISYQEAYYINKYQPPLNYQIPKLNNPKGYTINEKAHTITLDEIVNDKLLDWEWLK